MSRCSGMGRLRSGRVMPHLGVAVIGGLPRVPAHHAGWPVPGGGRPLPGSDAGSESTALDIRPGMSTLFLIKSSALEPRQEEIPAMTTGNEPRYVRPGRSTNVFNEAVAAMTRAGISIWGSRILAVRGRKSGEWRTTPVNPLTLNGQRYLVAPRGETQWVRNMRAAGGGELRVGRRAEPFTATELADADKPPVL